VPLTSLTLSHCPPPLQPLEGETCCVEWAGDALLPAAMKSMIRCLKTEKMKKLHGHRMESISKRAVTGIRKRANETGDAVTKQERLGEGQESRMRFCYKSHLQTHIQKK